MSPESVFLDFSARKLGELCSRIEVCTAKLTPEQIWARGHENENAVGNLMLHLAGNVRQWILHGVGGQPDHRQRDTEFAARGGLAVEELARRLRGTVDEAIAVIRSLPPEKLTEVRTIQKHYSVALLEAIYHVVEHFSQHTGQIIFATKLLTGEDLGFYGHLKSPKAAADSTP